MSLSTVQPSAGSASLQLYVKTYKKSLEALLGLNANLLLASKIQETLLTRGFFLFWDKPVRFHFVCIGPSPSVHLLDLSLSWQFSSAKCQSNICGSEYLMHQHKCQTLREGLPELLLKVIQKQVVTQFNETEQQALNVLLNCPDLVSRMVTQAQHLGPFGAEKNYIIEDPIRGEEWLDVRRTSEKPLEGSQETKAPKTQAIDVDRQCKPSAPANEETLSSKMLPVGLSLPEASKAVVISSS